MGEIEQFKPRKPPTSDGFGPSNRNNIRHAIARELFRQGLVSSNTNSIYMRLREGNLDGMQMADAILKSINWQERS